METKTVFEKNFNTLQAMIKGSRSMVVLTGAGISTLSGIPDFRSTNGVYAKRWNRYQVEEILSIGFFQTHPELFYQWAKEFWYKLDLYKPNVVHTSLATLERKGYIRGIFTQNIDMLHKKAGSKKCYELHGSAEHHHCTNCNSYYSYETIAPIVLAGNVPRCTQCGAVIKPDITFYGENLDTLVLSKAYEMFSHSDLTLVLGSSLVVQPAANLPYYALENNAPLVIVNAQKTGYDRAAVVHFSDLRQFGEALASFAESLPDRKSFV
ncbi:MAG: NAD-dependent protein deacylase [Sphaerochaetaceae bacterium]